MARMDISMDRVELAAQTGAPDALFELGMLYATGLDVAADLVVAHKWFNLAAMRGNGSALDHRREIAREMSAAQIAAGPKARPRVACHAVAHRALKRSLIGLQPLPARCGNGGRASGRSDSCCARNARHSARRAGRGSYAPAVP